jgi:hypothetical protein
MAPVTVEELSRKREEIRNQLASVGDLRPGSLVGRYRRCGKPTCHCAKDGAEGHGPSWSLTHAIKGKTVTRIIPAEAVDRTKAQLAEYERFRALSKEFIDTSEALCAARLGEAASQEGAEKKGSARTSRPKAPPKSRR